MEKATYCEKTGCINIAQGTKKYPCRHCADNKYNNIDLTSWYQREPEPEEIKNLKQQLKARNELIKHIYQNMYYDGESYVMNDKFDFEKLEKLF